MTGDNDSLVTVSGLTYALPYVWIGEEGCTNLITQVCVYVAPKRNLEMGFCEVYEVLLTVGADGKFDKAEQAVAEKADWGGQNICGAVHFRLPLIVPGQDTEILSSAAIRQVIRERR